MAGRGKSGLGFRICLAICGSMANLDGVDLEFYVIGNCFEALSGLEFEFEILFFLYVGISGPKINKDLSRERYGNIHVQLYERIFSSCSNAHFSMIETRYERLNKGSDTMRLINAGMVQLGKISIFHHRISVGLP